jgi:predicted phosphodiesterase
MACSPPREPAVRVALLADIHGNAIALERCLAEVTAMDVDALHVIGDVVGYIAGEQACLDMLQGEGVACQRGNHEQMLLAPTAAAEARDDVYQLAAVRARMSSDAMRLVASWPTRREMTLSGRRVLLVHGSPDDPLDGYVYPDSDLSIFASLRYDAVLMAHTHRPFVARVGETLVANVGSIGLPRDVGALSSLAVYDAETNHVDIFRVTLDVQAVLAHWGEAMHDITRACLHRSAPEFVGEVIG